MKLSGTSLLSKPRHFGWYLQVEPQTGGLMGLVAFHAHQLSNADDRRCDVMLLTPSGQCVNTQQFDRAYETKWKVAPLLAVVAHDHEHVRVVRHFTETVPAVDRDLDDTELKG